MYIEVDDGYVINVGDTIVKHDIFGDRKFIVHRVTPKRAYIRWNDVAEGVFVREYKRPFRPLGFSSMYSMVSYKIYKKVEE